MKRRIFATAFIAVAVSVIVYFSIQSGAEPKYRTEAIKHLTIKAICTATGTVNPLKTILVGTQVSGRIKELYADYNSPVKKGQLIAEIDPATFLAQLEQARANHLSAQANLAKAQASLQDAQRNYDRIQQLFQNSIVGQSELDTATTNHTIAESQVNVALAQVGQTKAALTFAQTNLRYTKICSPVDGIVISRDVDVGQTVAASFQTPTLFNIAQDLKKMQINTNVDEADIGKIILGQDAEFTVDAYLDTIFTGTVQQIRNAPIVVQNVVTYDVVITVENPELKLKPGMTANVTIIVAVKENIPAIPNAALRFKPKGVESNFNEQKGPCVWILKNKEPVCVPVTTGISDYTNTELTSDNLSEGQHLLVGYREIKKR